MIPAWRVSILVLLDNQQNQYCWLGPASGNVFSQLPPSSGTGVFLLTPSALVSNIGWAQGTVLGPQLFSSYCVTSNNSFTTVR